MLGVDDGIIPAELPCMSSCNPNTGHLVCLGSPFERTFSRGGRGSRRQGLEDFTSHAQRSSSTISPVIGHSDRWVTSL